MINKGTIPDGKTHKGIHLTACKLQLMDIAAGITNGSLTTVEDISTVIWADIEEVDLMLEG